MEKYWYSLLKNWKDEGKRGYTIPFLIGSQQYLPETFEQQDIAGLFLDIVSQDQYCVYITYCLDLNDVILCTFERDRANSSGYYPTFGGASQTAIYVAKIIDENCNLETLIERFVDRYSDFIKNSQYSIRDEVRGDYSDSEIQRIKNVFKIFK